MKTGILGGTFDPIHLAHLRIAEEVREACALDEVLFIPAAVPPHKAAHSAAPFADRLAMVRAAIADNPFFRVSPLEAQRSGKSFSVDTLELLRQADPSGERFFIVGLDSFRDIATWKDYRRLFELAHMVVTARPGVELAEPLTALPVAVREDFCYDAHLKKLRHRCGNSVIFLEETRLDISSTVIRRKVAAGESIRYLVPPAAVTYIVDHGLYRNVQEGSC